MRFLTVALFRLFLPLFPILLLVFAETDDCELDPKRLAIFRFLSLGLFEMRSSSSTNYSTYILNDQLVVTPDFVHIC